MDFQVGKDQKLIINLVWPNNNYYASITVWLLMKGGQLRTIASEGSRSCSSLFHNSNYILKIVIVNKSMNIKLM